MPKLKYRHWNANLQKPRKLGFIENHPEMRINRFTHMQHVTHNTIRVAEAIGFSEIVMAVGEPKA